MKEPQQLPQLGRRAFLGASGGAALTLLSALVATDTETTAAADTQSGPLRLEFIARYESGIYDEGGAEIASYDSGTERAFVINADAGQADILDLSDPATPTKVGGIDPRGPPCHVHRR